MVNQWWKEEEGERDSTVTIYSLEALILFILPRSLADSLEGDLRQNTDFLSLSKSLQMDRGEAVVGS